MPPDKIKKSWPTAGTVYQLIEESGKPYSDNNIIDELGVKSQAEVWGKL